MFPHESETADVESVTQHGARLVDDARARRTQLVIEKKTATVPAMRASKDAPAEPRFECERCDVEPDASPPPSEHTGGNRKTENVRASSDRPEYRVHPTNHVDAGLETGDQSAPANRGRLAIAVESAISEPRAVAAPAFLAAK